MLQGAFFNWYELVYHDERRTASYETAGRPLPESSKDQVTNSAGIMKRREKQKKRLWPCLRLHQVLRFWFRHLFCVLWTIQKGIPKIPESKLRILIDYGSFSHTTRPQKQLYKND